MHISIASTGKVSLWHILWWLLVGLHFFAMIIIELEWNFLFWHPQLSPKSQAATITLLLVPLLLIWIAIRSPASTQRGTLIRLLPCLLLAGAAWTTFVQEPTQLAKRPFAPYYDPSYTIYSLAKPLILTIPLLVWLWLYSKRSSTSTSGTHKA